MPHTPDHLCVLVHGLWGNPSHLEYVATALRERYGDSIYILAAKSNAGHFTYDGIELGGERLAHEVEETLAALADDGYLIKKLSFVGYSLGGLVARYAVGLLDARGWFDKLQPVNFTTFATPHVGVRASITGIRGYVWNALAPRTLSVSGRQLFLIDSFRETGKPLLCVLADPGSIFVRALARFMHRCVYANAVNDRSAPFYTTFVTAVDPFTDMDKIEPSYVEGYEPIIIDPDIHVQPLKRKQVEPFASPSSRAWNQINETFHKLSLWSLIAVVLPVFIVIYLGNSVIQTVRSRQRIRLHEGKDFTLFEGYRVPLMIQEIRHAVQDAFNVDEQGQSIGQATNPLYTLRSKGAELLDTSTLPLTPVQLTIIDALNRAAGFRKYPVYIHNNRHSHAAIIVRARKSKFDEGKIVIRHWLDHGFMI